MSTFHSRQILLKKLDLVNKLYIFARVNPAAFAGYRQEIVIGKWIPIPNTGGRRYYVELPLVFDPANWSKLIEDLNYLLTAYFIVDYQPRELVDFKIVTDNKNSDLVRNAFLTFGNSDFVEFPDNTDLGDEILLISPRIMGFSIFNSPTQDLQFSEQYPWRELQERYTFLKLNPKNLLLLELIRESFLYLNSTSSTKTFPRQNELIIGVILMVSALESLILNNDKEEIRLKFSLVGATLYEKWWPINYKLSIGGTKLSFEVAKLFFKTLYDIRSDFAHGSLNAIKKTDNKYWKKLAKIFKVQLVDGMTLENRIRQYSLILALIQGHITVFVVNAIQDFSRTP